MSLSKESIKRLRQVKRAILAEPKFYNQGHFPEPGDTCNTPCCIAGWAVWLQNPNRFRKLLSTEGVRWISELAKSVGLDHRQSLVLFGDFYPTKAKPGTKAHALLGAKKIERFIKTGGAE